MGYSVSLSVSVYVRKPNTFAFGAVVILGFMGIYEVMKKILVCLLLFQATLSQAAQPGLGFGENQRLDELFAEMQGAGEGAASAEREAVRIFRQSGSPAMDLLLARGMSAIEAEDFSMAIWHLSALIDHAPDFAEAYNARATAFYLMGKFGEAMADIETTLALNPRHFGALIGMGAIQEGIGHPENALKAYKAALSLNPASTEIADMVKRVEDEMSLLH